MSPACLQTSEPWVLKGWNGTLKPVWFGDKVRVKDGDQFASRRPKPVIKRASLISLPVYTMDQFDIYAARLVLLHQSGHQIQCIVSGVIQHLDLQAIRRVVQARDCAQ